jgi:ribosomal protein S12 methylthiotransferase accessory factor
MILAPQTDKSLAYNPACLNALSAPGDLAEQLGLPAGQLFELGQPAPAPEPGELRCLVFDLRSDWARAIEAQRECFQSNAAIFFIGFAPGVVQFGPIARPDQTGCLDCWKMRTRNNHRGPEHKAPTEAGRVPHPQKPLTAAAAQVARELLQHYFAEANGENGGELFAGSYMRLRTDDLTVSRHRFQPVTHCLHCAGAHGGPRHNGKLQFRPRLKLNPTDKRVANPKLSLAGVRTMFVDRYSGLIKHVFQDPSSNLMPLFSAEMQLLGLSHVESGYGRAEHAQKSELIAILEAIERYAGHEPKAGQESLRGSFGEMRAQYAEQVMDPECFILHHEEQQSDPHFRLKRYTPELPFNWCRAHSMRRDESVLVPEQFAYYHLTDRSHAPTNRFAFDSSNGCSLGGCIEEAILGGLYEVVERDAYFATWYTRIAPPRIATDSIDDPRCKALIARAEADGFEIYLFNIMSDVRIPTVWGMIVDPAEDAVVKSYCASACHGRWSEAVFSALVEVTTSIGVYRRSMVGTRDRALELFHDAGKVRDMPDHVLLYSLPEAYERLQFLHGGPTVTLAELEAEVPSLEVLDVREELRQQSARVLAVADDIVVVDQTFANMEKLGLACVKVLAPGLLPVTFGHQYRRISYGRLNKLAALKGEAAPDYHAGNINHHPHNFP